MTKATNTRFLRVPFTNMKVTLTKKPKNDAHDALAGIGKSQSSCNLEKRKNTKIEIRDFFASKWSNGQKSIKKKQLKNQGWKITKRSQLSNRWFLMKPKVKKKDKSTWKSMGPIKAVIKMRYEKFAVI